MIEVGWRDLINYIFEYIEENFPSFFSDTYLRFELGEPYENGTDLRINQVINRVTTLFEEVFKKDDIIYVYIKDWEESEDIMFGNTTPNYLYELINHLESQDIKLYDYDEDINAEGKSTDIKIPYKLKILKSKVSSIPFNEILTGIANYEQGREPSIGQRVYFINTEANVIFNMYDDRGCIILSKEKKNLSHLYLKYYNWLVDYGRTDMDNIFMNS